LKKKNDSSLRPNLKKPYHVLNCGGEKGQLEEKKKKRDKCFAFSDFGLCQEKKKGKRKTFTKKKERDCFECPFLDLLV